MAGVNVGSSEEGNESHLAPPSRSHFPAFLLLKPPLGKVEGGGRECLNEGLEPQLLPRKVRWAEEKQPAPTKRRGLGERWEKQPPSAASCLGSPVPQGPLLADGATPGPSPPGHCGATHPPETDKGEAETQGGQMGRAR